MSSQGRGYSAIDGINKSHDEVTSFKDLQAWKLGLRIAVVVYETTKKFPQSERYVLSAQLRRSAGSIPANIAEGFGRYAPKEYLQFLFFARGSLAETQSHLCLAHAVGLLSDTELAALEGLCTETRKTLYGLIRHIRRRTQLQHGDKISEQSVEYTTMSLDPELFSES